MSEKKFPPRIRAWKIPHTVGAWAAAQLEYLPNDAAPVAINFISEAEHESLLAEEREKSKKLVDALATKPFEQSSKEIERLICGEEMK